MVVGIFHRDIKDDPAPEFFQIPFRVRAVFDDEARDIQIGRVLRAFASAEQRHRGCKMHPAFGADPVKAFGQIRMPFVVELFQPDLSPHRGPRLLRGRS